MKARPLFSLHPTPPYMRPKDIPHPPSQGLHHCDLTLLLISWRNWILVADMSSVMAPRASDLVLAIYSNSKGQVNHSLRSHRTSSSVSGKFLAPPTRAMGDISDQVGRPSDNGQIGIIDPDCRLIGLHLYDGSFKVIPIDNKGQLKEAFNIRLVEFQVLDIKFLYGCLKPTIVVLYQDNNDARHVKTYEVSLKEKDLIEGPWSQKNIANGSNLLIPVPMPLGGVIITGEETIVYRSATSFKAIPTTPDGTVIVAYERIDADGSRYLLGDIFGFLHLLLITHEKGRATELQIEFLGETSAASTISYLDNAFIYVGSRYGDSQLVKLSLQPDANGSHVRVLQSYVNLGPIVDFCVVNLEKQGQSQIVTCSGAFNDGSLRIVRNGIGINEQASVELQGIKALWSLRSSTDDIYDTFLVVCFINETRILAMNTDDELEEIEIEGFDSQVHTLFCQDSVHNQLIQVTASAVRLVSSLSRQLLQQWVAPPGYSINVATANETQILLATGGSKLVYMEIGDGKLIEIIHITLEYEISCLDISPIGQNSNFSSLAIVGMWTDVSARIFSLPDLDLLTIEHLGGEFIPRSVLLCTFEGAPYLLCALGDGHLFSFLLNINTGELSDRKKVSLGMQPITLRAFSSKNTTHVIASSDRPSVIYGRNKKLLYGNVNLKEVRHICPFNSAAFPDSATHAGPPNDTGFLWLMYQDKLMTRMYMAKWDPGVEHTGSCYGSQSQFRVLGPHVGSCLAIAKEGELTIGTIDDIQKLHIHTVPLGEHARRISYQEQSQTLAVCSFQSDTDENEMHFVRLFDDQTFEMMSVYELETYECGCSIVSCSFTDVANTYYCVGTAFALPEEVEPTKRKKPLGQCSLNSFHGKLLAAVNQKIQLYKWMACDEGSWELQLECGYHGRVLSLCVQTRGDLIVVGDLMKSISLLMYKREEGRFEELAHDRHMNWITAVEILDDDVFICAENKFNLLTLPTKEKRALLKTVGEYHLGEFVNCFHHGSLVMRLPGSELEKVPTIIFGTVNGAIGIIASLPSDLYIFLEQLQASMVKAIGGVGGLSYDEWRSFYSKKRAYRMKNFIDGDLIESFLDLPRNRMEEVSVAMGVPVEELCMKVEEMTRLH
ncbi:DNA damage-binding protein 1 [Acorus gramineus]|uniref:DNA damage-binding protein 1 n=1 Tax=Acorus gramineus TaxID=55184 RepID=A0AAV9BNR2_ACOGR|nr:DNA damage-binding protein 1 [Acorus gramineus]